MLPNVPAFNVPDKLANVKAPFIFSVPAPPDISITLLASGVEPAKLMPPWALSVPVVIAICPILVAPLFVTARVINPETVAAPALIFHDIVAVVLG